MPQRLVLMNIKDKVKLAKNNECCPPHYLPHKIPIGKKVTGEPCHTHCARWRRLHHNSYCRILKCPHFRIMKEKTSSLLKAKRRNH
jgi:hypothetical protein